MNVVLETGSKIVKTETTNHLNTPNHSDGVILFGLAQRQTGSWPRSPCIMLPGINPGWMKAI